MISKRYKQKYKKPKLFKIWNFSFYGTIIFIGFFHVYLYSDYIFIKE